MIKKYIIKYVFSVLHTSYYFILQINKRTIIKYVFSTIFYSITFKLNKIDEIGLHRYL